MRKGDTSKLVDLLEDLIARIDRLKSLLRDPTYVSINLVCIAYEAGYGECYRTVRYLEGMAIPIQQIVINHIIPNFGDDVWATAETNPAAALIKSEYDIQQPYLARYKTLTSVQDIRLVGMTRLPFEPRSSRLSEVALTLWGERGLRFQITPSLESNENTLTLHIPRMDGIKWSKDNWSYSFKDNRFQIPLERPAGKIKRKRKGDSVVLTWSD